MPVPDPAASWSALLEGVRSEVTARTDGRVADYIPELADAPPTGFALAACGVDGGAAAVGDDTAAFTMQSVVKPFLYAAALARHGRPALQARVGVEPSGAPFDAVVRLEPDSGRPLNPLVNAGALAVCSLLAEGPAETRVPALLRWLGGFLGRADLVVDMPVYLSERATGDRNRAIAHLLDSFGVLAAPVEDTLDLYFHACAVSVTAPDLARAAAVLARGGVDPRSGSRVLDADLVGDVLAVMATCGLYDASGRFLFETGLAAKSGVSGGVLAVSPGRVGLAAWAPPLDAQGNSVRGVAAMAAASARAGLHALAPAPAGPARVAAVRGALPEALTAAQVGAGGAPATYLGAPPAGDAAVAFCGVDGAVTSAGAAGVRLSMQATANPFAYALALQACGLDAVHARVGVEPSGNPYHAILLDPATRRPFNPLGNAGAIAVAALQPGAGAAARCRGVLSGFAAFAGVERCTVDAGVLAAEHRHGARNRAIAWLLRNQGVLEDVDGALDLYFQQCAVTTTPAGLAAMAATLANGGVQPATGARVLAAALVPRVLAVMYTCGLHDASGRFARDVDLPAKSGVSGLVVAVVPGVGGLAAWAPGVDGQGASPGAVAALAALSRRLRLGVFAPALDA